MSTATATIDLSAAISELHATAIEALTRLIRTELDPRELRRLVTIALRYKDPGRPPKRPDRDREPPLEPTGRSPRAKADRVESRPARPAPIAREVQPALAAPTAHPRPLQPAESIAATAQSQPPLADPPDSAICTHPALPPLPGHHLKKLNRRERRRLLYGATSP